ncbi:hypothetical protein SAMN02745664_11526 [Moraxella cuniculi DSM 21768]|uniref:Quercetin 2,3-dioxygenase n=1 Tax=Moraxella cuniculi DSM 21768 TaxID=1122245 RepID=A0A1N7FP53_9GAMM|nr:pirin family protein [Moraxella cuniculi]OOS04736.1 quercetin 2,3-dioxygenase [Moraxella cuniculi]SIS02044.1 hypothetical protein SAMN02745664_11526 [Moraxella cuniculi DSM 21768]
MKQVLKVYSAPTKHWVGDGFLVHTMFHYQQSYKNIDPFLLMDYAAPHYFASNTAQPKGVGEHPHRGFQTVTIAYQGEVAHQDSAGGGGVIKSGDVQWMTAGSGVMHEEFHSPAFSQAGGVFEMVQLWVNLAAKDKMTPPKYQAIKSDTIPTVNLLGAGTAKIIAGTLDGITGPADTFGSINLWDTQLIAGGGYVFDVPQSHNLLILVLSGEIVINDTHTAQAAELATFEQGGQSVKIHAISDAKILILTGEPINEPVVGHGPFVMNTKAQIIEAIDDVQRGNFGQLRPISQP